MADLIPMKPKYPEEVLDYSMNWAPRLATGEAIVTHTATVVRGSAVVSNEGMASAALQVFWLSGGVAGEDTLIELEITTDSVPARVHEILMRVRIAPGS